MITSATRQVGSAAHVMHRQPRTCTCRRRGRRRYYLHRITLPLPALGTMMTLLTSATRNKNLTWDRLLTASICEKLFINRAEGALSIVAPENVVELKLSRVTTYHTCCARRAAFTQYEKPPRELRLAPAPGEALRSRESRPSRICALNPAVCERTENSTS